MAVVTSNLAPSSALEKSVPPNQSLYIRNLPEKLQKYDLKRALYMLFSTYGPVLDIIALKTPKMRGQAHVLFRDIASATQAMRNCQGYEFFGREMSISYAKSRSHTLAKLTGTFHEPEGHNAKSATAQQAGATQSSFPAPPGTLPRPPNGLPPPPGLSQQAGGLKAHVPPDNVAQNAPSPSGMKRAREESDDEGAPMEEDDDSGGEMEMSDDD